MPAKKGSAADRPFVLTVLAGVNGAGKSSIGGAHLRQLGAEFFNPDEVARKVREVSPSLSQTEANSFAWTKGKNLLEAAIANRTDFAFETTLGGNTITALLIEAAKHGAILNLWYAGLESVELHLQRVAARVQTGGHDIPEHDIRKRWTASLVNLTKLIPLVANLRVYDNSVEADPTAGVSPEPKLLLAVEERVIAFPGVAEISETPAWARPIVMKAYKEFLGTP
jgi:predicted ABC-type ATPase